MPETSPRDTVEKDTFGNPGRFRRFLRTWPVICLLLLVWAAVLVWGLGTFALHQRPDLVRNRIDALLAQHFPAVTLSAGTISPSLWPSPGVRLHDVLLRGQDMTLLSEVCELQFRWGDLFSGRFVPGALSLENATAQIVLPASQGVAVEQSGQTLSPVLRGLAALNGLTLNLNNVAVDVTSQTPQTPSAWRVQLHGLSGSLTVPSGAAAGLLGLEPGEAALTWQDCKILGTNPESPDTLLRLRDARLSAESIRLSKDAPGLIRTGQVDFSVLADAGTPQNPALRDARINFKAGLALTAGPPDIHGSLNLSGIWHINGVAVPVEGALPFDSRDVRTGVDIVDGSLRMDTNSARITATFLPGDLALMGRVNVERFSLPRWFAFARDLPGSLVDTLDNIQGSFTFKLTPQGLNAPDLKFSVKDIAFTGSGGVEDWAKPVIRIDAQTDSADLNRVFPELADKPVAQPSFNGPPLIPGPTPLTTPDVGFFIRLKAKEADFWKCSGKGFQLEISPVWSSSGTEVDGVKIGARLEQFYNGRLEASLLARDALRLNLHVRNVGGEKLSRAMTGQAHIGGTLNAEADLTGGGDNLAGFLAGLNGSLNATLNGGFFTMDGKKTFFDRFAVQGDGLSGTSLKAAKLPPQLAYAGRWRLEMTPPVSRSQAAGVQDKKALQVTLNATGPVRFSTQFWLPVAMQNLPVRAVGSLDAVPFNLSGKVTAALSESRVAVADLSGRLAEADVSGNLTFTTSSSRPDVAGTFAVSTSDLRGVLARLGFPDFSTWPKQAFRRGELRAEVERRGKTLQLSSMRGTLDNTDFSGKLRIVDERQWSGDLVLTNLDTALYRNPPETKRQSASSPWPTAAMKELDVDMNIQIRRLQALDLQIADCRFPLTLKNGRLSAAPMSLQFGNAPQQAALQAEIVDNALSLRFSSTVRNADLRVLWKQHDAAGDSLGGLGNSNLNLYGLSRSPADIPACLNGTWSGNIQNGFFSTGKARRDFISLSASGSMKAGVLTSRDFLLSGKNYTVRGGGNVNLVNRTLDYRLTASLPGVPSVPITYSGSLADPKRSINALSTVASVLGNVGKGVYSLLDSFLSVPLNLLR